MREIIVDNFAGGGGASTGIEMAIGRSVDIAINHDPNAIAMHTTNHPDTLHYCESVFDIDPVAATAGRPVGLAWFSPDCRHFSKAKGSKPVKKEIRGLAWIVLRWALSVRPRVMMLENVEEFKTWGPLLTNDDGTQQPDPARAGETFEAFCGMLSDGIPADHPALAEACEFLGIGPASEQGKQLIRGLGYNVDYRELRACDYGAPTIRKRFFMVMRCDGHPVEWPEVTHGDPKLPAVQAGKLQPWRTAAECIDWSIPCPSIFERKKPLAENTLKRIARGLERFVTNNPNPFIVKCNHTSTKTSYDCFRGQSLDEPLQTITRTHGFAVVQPFLVGAGGPKYSAKPRSTEQPMNTMCNTNHSALITPYIARIGQTGFGGDRMAYDAKDPLTTVVSKAEHLLIAPVIARQFGNSVGHGPEEPNGTITAGGGGKSQLVSAFLAKHFGGNYTGAGVAMDEPAHTVTTVDHHAVVAAHLLVNNTGHPGGSVDAPAHTITTGNHHALVTSNLIKMRGTNTGQRTDTPLQTVTAGGNHFGEVRAFLLKYYGNEKEGVSLDEPLHTVTTNDRFGLVTVEGIDYQIVDIGMRMLQPHELYAAQGFPEWYIIDQDFRGVKYAKDKQVARCGNAVPPPFAEALVRANLPDMCVKKQQAA
ncbi:DNA cytosine methyltransferase [Pectobacterium brasiliense]|uniref:DNA (cytosine-5-)-methyltransferase n=1 Tax=Pectobacterium brasiliense TaxID=180957 RepID=A0A3S5K257_9GAMM|nr:MULTISPECIES: DNA cytosine methyltransferase [Pectobacterium]GKW27799.1 DNA methyltransferase [Pectobacterium carotovorum subsp. carotovorum]MBN3046540.1 DNA cytosine methyltransferase [Pectobacterium brasiliense]MBN3056793.1 DNA cytosine methyltransferase [Pectobacterium brasiliense]MBN3075327.1 DNA cytosine methyltransferase [Pectobacterium brasiliense]MBN3083547.1 DNA cytosine methyltransferase [Pectobacterium brasiliense]